MTAPATTTSPNADPSATPVAAGSAAGSETSSTPPPGASSPSEPAATPDPVAEVLSRRDAAALAKLMRDKRELDERASRYKDAEPHLEGLGRARKHAEGGDHARAIEAAMELLYGEKAKEVLPHVYEGLTARIVGSESASQATARLTQETSRLRRELEEMQDRLSKGQAEYEKQAAAIAEQRVESGIKSIKTMLEQAADKYPYLMAESDAPEHVVWDLMVAQLEKSEKPPEPEEAMKLANDHFQKIFEKKKDRYKNLLAPQGANGSNTHGSPPSPSQGQRQSLTNADASRVPDLKTPQPIRNREESIEAAFQLLKARHQQT